MKNTIVIFSRLGVGNGIVEGGKNFFSGIKSGIRGLAMRPYEGEQNEGVLGLAKGVGTGILGLALKPILGVTEVSYTQFCIVLCCIVLPIIGVTGCYSILYYTMLYYSTLFFCLLGFNSYGRRSQRLAR